MSTFLFLFLFSAIADLLDNAVDEIQNGATFVIVDKTSNPRDGSPALLIQDKKMLRSSLSFIMDQMHDELLKLEGQPSKERRTFLKSNMSGLQDGGKNFIFKMDADIIVINLY
ncbi:unnamed protein product [Prunus brigantina]